ncbi:MAG: bifunctional aspartate kinase/homoserine dehydrogenase I [Flammeovirgaceae bacterium]
MKVLKFGGTSVGSIDSIQRVKDIVQNYLNGDIHIALVVSAQKGVTNLLESIGQQAAMGDEDYKQGLEEIESTLFNIVKGLIGVERQSKVFANVKIMLNNLEDILHGVFLLREFSPRIRDLALSFGERLSATIITAYFNQEGIDAELLDARKIIQTNDNFGAAKVDFTTTNRLITEYFDKHKNLQVITGFVASNHKGQTTTLGRGGSDYTVSIIGAALDAYEVEIWTDVDGVMTTDPRKVKRAFSLPAITYMEAMEMTHFGAKVIYPPTLQPLVNKRIPLRIRNTFNTDFEGTYIGKKTLGNGRKVSGISSIEEVILVNVQGSGMMGIPGIAARLFSALARTQVNVILITQASSEHSICFAVSPNESERAKLAIEEEFAVELAAKKLDPIILEKGRSIIAAIGEKMREMPGVAAKFFNALGKNGINVTAIAQGSSEWNISVVIDRKDLSKALNALHGTFFLQETRNLNLFIVGTGLIGKALLHQLAQQADYFLEERFLRINVIGLSNSKKMVFNKEGIPLDNWEQVLHDSNLTADMEGFVRKIRELNLPNSVFVDNTASTSIIKHYPEVLKQKVSIATPNKKANSSDFEFYELLQRLALSNNVKFGYETTVGAGLPVIKTLQEIVLSGDQIHKIEGVLSGTLSYLFNTYDGSTSFSELVKSAKAMGYTEPDPRDDLNGMDVARKILILAREVGENLEISDVSLEKFLPEACFSPESIDDFFVELEKVDDQMKALYDEAAASGKKLRYVASFEGGKAKVELKTVDENHPFYNLQGGDNIIAYTTKRYQERPLVVKGPGAGAEVTAAGVFADLLIISNFLQG